MSAISPGLDVGDLYRSLAPGLERQVRRDVRTSEVVIEDACQNAWIRLIHHRHEVRPQAVWCWLTRTAVNEALKLLQSTAREIPFDATSQSRVSESPAETVIRRVRLEQIGTLPGRQQRLVWLHALGLSYTEIAAHERCTTRTVERQLLRAKRRLVRSEVSISDSAPNAPDRAFAAAAPPDSASAA